MTIFEHLLIMRGRSRFVRPLYRVRWKIMIPYAALTMVFAALATYSITRLVTSSLEDRFNRQLVEVGRVTSDAVVRRERSQVSALRSVAYTTGLADAVALGDAPSIAKLVEPATVNNRAERVGILDTTGHVLFGQRLVDASSLRYASDLDGTDPESWSAVADVLAGRKDDSGDKWVQIVWTPDGLVLYTVGPIQDASGRLVGVVLVGSSLDSLVAAAKVESTADVTIFDLNGHPLATTFAVDSGGFDSLAPRSALATGSTRREPRKLFGREYTFLYGDLRVRNEVVGRFAAALPTGAIGSAGATTQKQLSVVFGLVTLVVFVVGWIVAYHITNPLSRLLVMAKAVSRGDLSARSGVRSSDEIGELAASFDAMAEKLQRQHLATIGALASAIDARDPHTAGHSMRVGDLSADLGRQLGMVGPALHCLRVGGILHDIGKIGIPDDVLLKPDRLTAEERTLIQQHPSIGLRILEDADLAPEVLSIVGGHHERLNGSGYPLGLAGDKITIFARIAAVADVYDALTTSRPYRRAMTSEDALTVLRRETMEGLLDPDVVAAMVDFADEWEERRQSIEPLTMARARSLLQVNVA